MFQFFKRKGGKATTDGAGAPPASVSRAPNDKTNEKRNLPKDVVNLLIPETDYTQKTGVSIFNIMAGKRRKGRKKGRTESFSASPPRETHIERHETAADVTADRNSPDARTESETDPAEFVKALVLQKYAKTPAENKQHVCTVYVSKPDLDEKRHTEALLREIARSIDCTVDQLNDKQMGGADSKTMREPVYQTIEEKGSNSTIDSYKHDLKNELDRLTEPVETAEPESPNSIKKSNLKLPKSDTEGCSDDDRSDNGKKKVTFRKHIIFDDGEQQTDEENDSFESLSSEEEEFIPQENKTVIKVNETIEDRKIFSDSSDSGFLECDRNGSSDETTVKSGESESDSETEIIEIIEEEISGEEYEEVEEEVEEEEEEEESTKSLVKHEDKFQNQVESRTEESERARELITACRKEIEAKDQEIEQLKCDLASAYKESEMIRQRGRSLEEDLNAARSCSASLADELQRRNAYKESEMIRQRGRSLEEDLNAARTCSASLADQLQRRNDEWLRELRLELEDANTRRAELESRAEALERDKDRLEQEKKTSEQKALEALSAAEATTAKWRAAHEAARSQAAARAERMLADCEWKTRELEQRARKAERTSEQLAEKVEKLESRGPTPAQMAELQQLRGLATDQQRSVQALTLQLQRLETREEALKLEVHRLKELLEREETRGKERELEHSKKVKSLEENHSKTVVSLKSEHTSTLAGTHASLAKLRSESEQARITADKKLRDITNRYESLKELLAAKESQFEVAISEARSKSDWETMQLRHLLDKADINYANKVDELTNNYETEKERLIEEWTQKLKEVEEQAAVDASNAQKLLESSRLKLMAEKLEQINKLKEQHKREMDDQWEQFMTDKETCLERMKSECRQEGDEERVKREKELLEEIAELKSQVHLKSSDFDNLAVKAAACGRTLAVTEQELRDTLAREKELRSKRSEDSTRIKQLERSCKDQVEHLTRKCACLRKLFDDIRARLAARERSAEQDARSKDKEIHQLRGEVARLTKLLVEQSSPKLGARTRADGCEVMLQDEKPRKGSIKAVIRKRTCPLPELTRAVPERPRANSVDLPAVQVPVRIRQLEGRK